LKHNQFYTGLTKLALGTLSVLQKYKFGLLAFLVPLTIRVVPEIIAGGYPIGYDTITSYVPLMIDWSQGKTSNQFDPLGSGWLLFAILGTAYTITRVDPIMITKVTAPVLYGLLGYSEFAFARRFLHWDCRKSLFLVLVASSYFVFLRLSWDLLRNTLGLSLLLLVLSVTNQLKSVGSYLLFSAEGVLVTFAHPLMAALLMLATISAVVIDKKGNRKNLLALAPAGFLVVMYLSSLGREGVPLIMSGASTASSLSYLLPAYLFLPLLPGALLGFRSLRFVEGRYWLLLCCLGIVIATAPILVSSQIVSPERWTLTMAFPVAVYATEGFSSIRTGLMAQRTSLRNIGLFSIILIAVLGGAYVALPASHAFPYYRYMVPTSMLQSTIPLEQSQDVIASFDWLSTHARSDAALLVHDAMYGWAREYYKGLTPIVTAGNPGTLHGGLQHCFQLGFSIVYTVWWADGSGWYGEPKVPQGFVMIHQVRHFGVFVWSQ
jgi:hypothetical protein